MNVIDIVILAIFGICLVSGMYKGFIASGLTVLGFIVAWFAAKATYGALSEAILSNSSLMGVLSTYLEAADFFPSAQIASATVTEALASSTTIWNNALAAIQERLPFLAEAFASNVNTQAFASLGITTLADYLDQTIWTAAFQLLSFILLFFISYAVVTLLINLLSRVLRFPAMRGFDAIAGGLFGLVRGYLLVLLLLAVLPMALDVINIPSVSALYEESTLASVFGNMRLFNIQSWIQSLLY